ncbi:putative E3 ubiquitin-protein ligase LIN isoform X1 [Zingiber officinale]|uniref:putative E3 ubiquitin-protein ligase LIN isoform X1 n=1 Tax=Zingiber officinale TaxID=94328 RepID=UPI001C4A96BA|nr:putative E3 ubiquitin-protein ligase LIN isoform X1 [Zingiber officinale]
MMAPTPGAVLRHTTAFLDEALSNADLRHRILSSARWTIPSASPASVRALSLLSDALDSSSPAVSSAADKILLSVSGRNPLSAVLLALAHAIRGRAAAAALALLDLFSLDPSLARHDVAPAVFEALFLPHLLPALRWFADQRSHILSSASLRRGSPKDEEDEERSVEAAAAMSLLSQMSGGQAGRLKELERRYEDVIDANCRVYAEYLKGLVQTGGGGRRQPSAPPQLVLTSTDDEEAGSDGTVEQEKVETSEAIGFRDGRYNPIWAEADPSVEFFSRQNSRLQTNNTRVPPAYPQRVSPEFFAGPPFRDYRTAEVKWGPDNGPTYLSEDNLECSSSEIDLDVEERKTNRKVLETNSQQLQRHAQGSAERICNSSMQMADSSNTFAVSKQIPPKEFVCPITSNLFDDPVTLETGQTYERRAIQEWLDRGNSTCPITRQKLQSTQLPKTNYVLKRLIASWLEENPYSTPSRLEDSPGENFRDSSMSQSPSSPPSAITQPSNIDISSTDIRLAISCLCTSEFLDESEKAVLQIETFWRNASLETEITAVLSKPAVINGFVEILFNSVDPNVLKVTIFLLSELASRDKFVIQTLNRVDSDVKCMIALFKKGLIEAIVLIFLLNPLLETLIEMDIANAILMAIAKKDDELIKMCMSPMTASILILWKILQEGNSGLSNIVRSIISDRVLDRILLSLEAEMVEERIAATGIVLKCMGEDGRSRKLIAERVQLAPVLESFAIVNDMERFQIICFLFELAKLSRRLSNEKVLQAIKGGGAFSMMHSLLIYLQTTPMEQSPVVAGLLLQLDLLVEPRKMSIYREEAIDTLITCLKNVDFPSIQLRTAETILSLLGRFSSSGRPLARALLLKHAGIRKGYRALMETEQTGQAPEGSEHNLEEEKAAEAWERKMAFALVSHEFGLLFEALSDGLKSRNLELSSSCLVLATWLSYMLSLLPDTGVRGAARVCLMKQFITILKSARHTDEKALSMLALRSFMHDQEGLFNLTLYIKDILKTLRELKKSSILAYEMLKLLSDGHDSSIKDMWVYKELMQVDCSTNGEVVSVICFKNMIFSGHLDGMIKVWKGDENLLSLLQETHEHSKAVTSLAILKPSDKLYSGALDKSIRAWAILDGKIHCTEFFDMKDPVRNLSVTNTFACFTPQNSGLKVLSWNGGSKTFNSSKNVKSLVLVQGKLYCGCNDSSIQEIDLATETSVTIHPGKKKLLGKETPIYAVQVRDGLLFSAGMFVDGVAVKIWSTSDYSLVGSIQSSIEVRAMAISKELIYLGSKTGTLEIWSKEKHTAVGALQMGTNCRVQCIDVDEEGEMLVIGTSDGRLQVWGLT